MAMSAKKRLAVIASVYRYRSHAQHFCDRFVVGYPFAGGWHYPAMEIAALYVDQRPVNDQSEDRAREFGFEVYSSIAEALRGGGERLAVDGILLVVEHGEYPRNEKGQILYPRYEFFKACVRVFEEDGRAVPIYNDKHLSYSFDKAQEMVADAKRLGFPFLAGSSLPVTWRLPAVDVPFGAPLDEAVMVGCGGSDAMDYHALEAMQCMVERRQGGERGVRSVQLLEGEAVWEAGAQGVWSETLLEAALARSDSSQGLTLVDGRTQDLLGSGELRRLVEKPAAYLIEYRDGLRAALLMLTGGIADFCFAGRRADTGEVISTQFLLTPGENVTYSSCLVRKVEEMIESGVAPLPVERTMLVSGMLEACLASRVQGHARLDTPHLAVDYEAPRESTYMRV